MDVTAALGGLLDGHDHPLAPVAMRLAGLLDDPETAPNHAAQVSRELRQVLDEIGADAAVDDGEVFDLEARRREREKRRA